MSTPVTVLVAGAGPVGLTAAVALADNGVDVRVVDAGDGVDRRMRASTFHPATLDQLNVLGLAQPLIDGGLKVPRWQLRQHESGQHVTFDLGLISDHTAFPFRLQVEQHHYCELALVRLAQLSVPVTFQCAVQAVSEVDDGVTVRCSNDQTIRADWVIGADGANSAVRKSLNLDYGGITHRHASVLASTSFPFHEHLPDLADVSYCWSARGPFSLLRLKHCWRVSLYPGTDNLQAAAAQHQVRRWLAFIHPDAADATIENIHPYRVHQRCVDSFRAGRVLLAGDAAHLNPPSGGMGMNGGIHDATCLAAALLKVLDGGEPEALDNYSRQRRDAVTRAIIPQAAANRARMATSDPELQRQRLTEHQAIANNPDKAIEFLLRSSMITGLREASTHV